MQSRFYFDILFGAVIIKNFALLKREEVHAAGDQG